MIEIISMPELPEVETTKLGLEPLIVNQTVERVYLHRANFTIHDQCFNVLLLLA
jgi:formamidopyrimidine-DNA glycosylase